MKIPRILRDKDELILTACVHAMVCKKTKEREKEIYIEKGRGRGKEGEREREIGKTVKKEKRIVVWTIEFSERSIVKLHYGGRHSHNNVIITTHSTSQGSVASYTRSRSVYQAIGARPSSRPFFRSFESKTTVRTVCRGGSTARAHTRATPFSTPARAPPAAPTLAPVPTTTTATPLTLLCQAYFQRQRQRRRPLPARRRRRCYATKWGGQMLEERG